MRANLAALETLRQIETAERWATSAEQAVLARWSGWGAVPGVFENRPGHPNVERFAAERARLRELLSDEEYRAAERNTLNAHYTDAGYAAAIWEGLRALGFEQGAVLEPGCGSGTFIGLAPPAARMVGVELDPTTAAIAARLYPDAQILSESFADTRAPAATFDAVVGNVPFGDVVLADKRHNAGRHSIHNHFLVKSLHLTRPGGLVAVLTSRYTLDAANPAARREMAELADLVGAVRLPSGAHRAAAGTDAITDLLILRRREPGHAPAGAAWEQVRPVELAGGSEQVNEYFAAHPQRVLGEMTLGRGMYRDNELLVRATGDDTATALVAAVGEIAAEARAAGLTLAPGDATAAAVVTPVAELSQREDGHLRALPDGTFTQVADGRVVPHSVPATQADELRALLGLRDSVTRLLDAEAASLDDTEELDRLRGQLNAQYDGYVDRYGPLNRYTLRRTGRVDPETGQDKMARVMPPMGGFRIDPYAPTVFALEEFNEATGKATKADIFHGRVISPRAPRLGADTPEDALAICLDTFGEVRLDEVARLLGSDTDRARVALGTLVFDEPDTGRLVEAAEYLSGNVRAKLKTAQTAVEADPRFEVNVRALLPVIPRDLGPGEIEAALGASWIPAPYVEQFLREVLEDETVKVRHLGGADWKVSGNKWGVHARTTWGTEDLSAPELAQRALQQRPVKIYKQLSKDERVFDAEGTAAAQAKIAELNERFGGWVWEDSKRATDLARIYNDTLNAQVVRSYEGATRSLPGLAVTFTPRKHQVETVARMVNEPAVGIFHVVGAGKTAVMAMGVSELKRLGMVNKPCIVVPNHMLEQFQREFLWIYPRAKLLAAGQDDLQRDRRRRFVARSATGNWDAIIMSASFFERLPMALDERRRFLRREVDVLREKIERATQQAIEDGEKPERNAAVKQLQRTLQRKEERIKAKLAAVKDPGVTFEQTGIDYIVRDELHELKNDDVFSNIPDANIDGSDRAVDFRMKMDYLRRQRGLRVGSGATATPIANSVSEMYVVIRQLRPDLLEAANIPDFDTWAATFGQVVTSIEVDPTGEGFRSKSRFAKFRNVPELMLMMRTFGDVRTAEDLQLPTPPLAARPDGQRAPRIVTIEPAAELREFIKDLGNRADAVRGGGVDPKVDNMLKISGEARAASLDLRLVGQDQLTPGKVEVAADNIARIWAATRENAYPGPDGGVHATRGALQIVFCDLSTPADGWNVYDELRDQLTARGVPRQAVRYVHEARNDREKGALFAACRTGEVAVLVGSTAKMGVGTNVQARAVALHHLDCPWRPADVTQREGRIKRQGNLNPEIEIYRYVVEGSFDAYSWQTVARKATFIDQVMRAKPLDVREIEDIGDDALDYHQVKAIATGNPLLLEQASAAAELTRLERLERSHHYGQDALRRSIRDNEHWITKDEERLAALDQALAVRQDTRGDKFVMRVSGVPHTKRVDAGRALQALVARDAAGVRSVEMRELGVLGHLGGFDVTASAWPGDQGTWVSLRLAQVPDVFTRMYLDELIDADPSGLIRRLENHLAGLDGQRTTIATRIEQQRGEVERARVQLGQPFAKQAELTAARDRVQEINAAIAAQARRAEADTAGPSDADSSAPAESRPAGPAPAQSAAQAAVAEARRRLAAGQPIAAPAARRPGPTHQPTIAHERG